MNRAPQETFPEGFISPIPTAASSHTAGVQWDALLLRISNALPAMIWMCGTDGKAVLFNRRWLEFTGHTLAAALNGGWETDIHPNDRLRRRSRQEQARQEGRPFETEYRLRRADGEYRWILDQSAPYFGSRGILQGYLSVAVDITERKRAEEKLRWLSKAVEQSPATVVITDLSGTIEYVNPKFTEVTGYQPHEAIGENPRILKSGKTPPEEYRKMWDTLRTGEWRGEFLNKKKNGELYWEAASICTIRDDTGQPTHYLAVKEDITARKQMEAALRASEARSRMAIEHAQLTIYDLDPETDRAAVYGGDAFLNGLGSLREWAAAIHPDDRDRVLAAHRRRLAGPGGLIGEYRIVDGEGKIRYYSDHGAPICDGRVIGVLRNITADKQAEASIAQLAAIVECSTNAIISFDSQGMVESWNQAAQRLYGYSEAQILGRPACTLAAPDLRLTAAQRIAAVAAGAAAPPYETWHARQDGTLFQVSISASPIRDRAGKTIGGSVIIQDITGKKKAEEALRESENLFRALVRNSNDIITLIDPEGTILYDSPGIAGTLGYSEKERIGCKAFDWIHPEDLSRIEKLHRELLDANGSRLRAQVRLRHADGTYRWCDSWAANLLEESGVRALFTSFRDITELKGVEQALRDSEHRYRRLIEDASDIIFTIDLQGNFTSVNRIGERASGYRREELLKMSVKQITAAEYFPAVQAGIRSRLTGGPLSTVETVLIARDGSRICMEVSGRVQYRNGEPEGLLCIARDISQRKRSERLEHRRREVLEMVAQNQPLEAILLRLEEMIAERYPGTAARIVMAGPPGGGHAGSLVVPILAGDGHTLGQIEIDVPAGWTTTDLDRLTLDSKARLAAVAIEHRQLTDRLAHQAHHDPLTGLPNRVLLEDRLRQAITLAERYRKMVATIFVDLDRFKFINDTLGHDAGDLLLKQAAKRLQGAVRESDTLARTGGDEFVAVLYGIESAEAAEAAAERIVDTMRRPFEIMGQELFVSASVGLSIYPQDGEDAATLQKNADVAMYEAKSNGRNRFQKFAREMNSASHERLEIENDLHRALDRGELMLYYQPQFQLPSGELCGVEALLRWNHAKWGVVLPGRFIPVAEESGLIIPISLWVLEEACRQHRAWLSAGHAPLRIAVNISAMQFMRTNLARRVADVLSAHAVEPSYLELELTEGVLMRDVEDSTRQIAELRNLGVRISVDDFGTGYSSLGYLQRLPIDDLKIDKSFVNKIHRTSTTQPLLKAVIDLAHSLHMTATAEGVETAEEMAVLRELGCDRVQGFLLGRPAPPDQRLPDGLGRGCRVISDPGLPLSLPA